MKHSVYYNGKIMAIYKSLKYALAFVAKKGYKNDENNLLFIWQKMVLATTNKVTKYKKNYDNRNKVQHRR